jgi:hypothetical protein
VALLDGTGRVLERLTTAPSGLPVVGSLAAPGAVGTWVPGTPGAARSGDGPARPAAAEVLAVAAALPPALAAKVWTIEVAGQGVQLTVGMTTVVFGDTTQLADKVTALQTIVDQVPLSGIADVDLRVPGRPALTPTTPAR